MPQRVSQKLVNAAGSILLVPLVAIAACGDDPPDRPTVPDGASAGELVLEPCPYEVKEVEFEADCGILHVPENRNRPDSRLIALPVTRVRALEPDAGEPIFSLGGGPGGSNQGFSLLEGLIDQHDIVMVGYRGVDGSEVLDCPEVAEAFKNPGAEMMTRPAMESIKNGYASCAERLTAEGVDIGGYTMIEVVEDLEDTRRAMGYDRINMLSRSYGTRLAMFYAWRYPDHTHRSAMIAVNPPGHFTWDAHVIDDQIEYYSALCARDTYCGAQTDDLAEAMRRVARDMPDRWLFLPIDAGMAKMMTFILLYHVDTAAQAFDVWLAADRGDPSGLAFLSLMGSLMFPNAAVWGESAAKVAGADYLIDPSRDYHAETADPNTIIGDPVSWLGWAGLAGWPAEPIPEEYRQVQESDAPTLLISGSVDFSTPARHARDELLPHLSNGYQVILKEFGHTGDLWFLQPDATVHLLKTFFDTGEIDDSHFEYQPMDFEVGLTGKDWAKIGLAAIVLVLVLAFFVVRWGVRRVRRRRAAR